MSLPGIETGGLNAVAFDPQGQFLAAAGGSIVRQNNKSVTLRELIAWNLPAGNVRWHVLEQAENRFCGLAVRPDGGEYAAQHADVHISIWSPEGTFLRQIPGAFLPGPLTYSPDCSLLIAPEGNEVQLRDASSGQTTARLVIAESTYTSAKAVAFVPGTSLLVIAARVINNKGQISGKLLLADYQRLEVLKTAPIEISPTRVAVDPQQRWTCVAGERRGRGCIQFFDFAKWKPLADQGAHGGGIGGLAVSPDGSQIATCGDDNIVRIWRTDTCKTAAKLEQHRCKGRGSSGMAWSPDGNWIAYAKAGLEPPDGGVFLYQRCGELDWRLFQPHEMPKPTTAVAAGLPRETATLGTKTSVQATTGKPAADDSKWLAQYLKENASPKPLATPETVAEWEKKHQLTLPAEYTKFVTTLGRTKFGDLKGLEGLEVRIVGPNQLDAKEYRRDVDDEPSVEQEPDGLMFAVAINGDCLCFDLRRGPGQHSVHCFDHETERFEPFADGFAAAVRRLAEKT